MSTSGPPRYKNPRHLLEELLEGAPFGAAELAAVRDELDEDEHLDFKSGRVSTEKLKDILWQMVTGFANAGGGVLIVGVSDARPRKIESVTAAIPGNESPEVWAKKILDSAAARIAPPPRFLTVTDGNAKVLVVATARASQLIPFPDGKRLRYALRMGEATHVLSSEIAADLLLGRRSQPSFRVENLSFRGANRPATPNLVAVECSCVVENDSFLHAQKVVAGIVVPCLFGAPIPPITGSLRREIQYDSPHGTVPSGLVWQLRHVTSAEAGVLRPFEPFPAAIPPTGHGNMTNLPLQPNSGYLRFGLYVLAEGAPPSWHQVDWEYVVNRVIDVRDHPSIQLSGTPRVEPLYARQPIVTWRER